MIDLSIAYSSTISTLTMICCGPIGGVAEEVSVYVSGGVRSVVERAAVTFERDTGHTIKITFGTGGEIQNNVASGAPADVTVLPSKGITELEKSGLIVPGSRLEVGIVGVGVGIKSGVTHPKIATVDEFKDTLLAAKSITYADPASGGTSGTYFATVVLPLLGIVEQMRAKTVLTGVGEEAVMRVANGESELVVVQSSEITAVQGTELVGPLPRGIQSEIPYSAAVLKTSKSAKAAGDFVKYLVTPPGIAALMAAGFKPPHES